MNGWYSQMNGTSGIMNSWNILHGMLEHTAFALRRLVSPWLKQHCLGNWGVAIVLDRFRLSVCFALSLLVHWLILSIPGYGLGATVSAAASGTARQALHVALAGTQPESRSADNSVRWSATELASIPAQSAEVRVPGSTSLANKSVQPVSTSSLPEPASQNTGPGALLPPVLEQPFEPKYPLQAAFGDLRGSVTARFRIGKNGEPEDIEILDSSPGGFDAAVVEALAKTRIKRQSVRPDHWVIVSVVFDLAGTSIQSDFQQKK